MKASVQAAASVTTAPRSNQPSTWQLLPLRQVSLTKAQLVRVAEPQPGILPDTRQALAPELNANGSPVQNLAKVQAAERGVVSSCRLRGRYALRCTRSTADRACQQLAQCAREIASTGVCGFTWDSRAL